MKITQVLIPDSFTNTLIPRIGKIVLSFFLFLSSTSIIAQNSKVPWMEGSWGVRLIMQAGSGLDNVVDNQNYDYVEYARQINQNYPTAGHVITNFSGNANGTLFTLRQNANVNIATEIDPSMVPSLANEQIVFDVINELRNAGKKVILYVNFTPNMSKATTAQRANWDAYVNANFSGSYITAYNDLIEGFVDRFKGLIDGYWIDNFSYGTDAEKDSFVQMVRTTDPNVVLCTNYRKSYFTGIEVDSDGTNDSDATDYRVIKYQANDIWSEYTGGHITPIGQGAPSNSWGYEEFTVTDIATDNLSSVTIGGVSNNNVLKHMFTPIRERWTSPALPLLYDQDQAYRFVKRIVDAGGAITFSTTTSTSGLPMPDEVAVLTHVNDQLEINAGYVPYLRPTGAFLVGETTPNYNQIIDFPALSDKDVNDANFDPGAAASSGATVSYTSSNTSVAIIVGGNISIQGAGTTTITASQGGNGTFAAATNVSRQLTVTGSSGSTNIALNGTATQSTTLSGGVASRAIDGNTNGNFSAGFVSAAQGPNAWWEVDLGGAYSIDDINVFNRTNSCCVNRLSNFTVSVINGGTTIFSQTITSAPTPSETIDAGGAVGQIVRIESNLTSTLNLAEVEVFGAMSSGSAFVPDPSKGYYIDCPHHNLRLAADGSSDDPYTTSTSTTGDDVEWKFVDNGNGYWHIDRVAGGTQPRLRTDGTADADMNQPGTSVNTYYEFSEGNSSGTYFLTLPDGVANFNRLQINNAGDVKMTGTSSTGSWVSFTITEASSCTTFSTIQAETYDSSAGVVIESNTSDTGGGQHLGFINNNDWVGYDNVDLTCASSIQARVSSNTSGGDIEVRLGSTTGTLIGTIPITNTGGWNSWDTEGVNLNAVSGINDVYLVFTGGNGYLFNINWIEFSSNAVGARLVDNLPAANEEFSGFSIYPNPVLDQLTINIGESQVAKLDIVNSAGQIILSRNIQAGSTSIDLAQISKGIYIIKVTDGQQVQTRKIIKK